MAPRLGTRPQLLYAKNFFKTLTLIVCKTRPDVRIHVSGIVIRIRIRHTAIRIRIVVRPIDHTSPLGKSTFIFHFFVSLLKGGGSNKSVRPRSPILVNLSPRSTRCRPPCPPLTSTDGKTRPDARTHVSGIVIRMRTRHTAIRTRTVVRPIDHTSLLCILICIVVII